MGQGGMEKVAVKRESSVLLEQEGWPLPGKAGVGWAAYTKQLQYCQRDSAIPLLPLKLKLGSQMHPYSCYCWQDEKLELCWEIPTWL